MKKLTALQKAYIAGFLDGDGSVYVKLRRNDTYRYGYQIAAYIVFYQKEDHLRYLKEIEKMIGAGYIRIRKDKIVEYIIGDKGSLNEIAENLLPFSRFKHRQLSTLLKVLKLKSKTKTAKDFIRLCKVVDKFKQLNYSKKRIQTSIKVKEYIIKKGLLTP